MVLSPQAGEGVVVNAIVECGIQAAAGIFCIVGAAVPRLRRRADYPLAVPSGALRTLPDRTKIHSLIQREVIIGRTVSGGCLRSNYEILSTLG